jgi:DNA-binding MarR family transcriptional regulator
MNNLQKLFFKQRPTKIITGLYRMEKRNGGEIPSLTELSNETGIEKTNVSQLIFEMQSKYELVKSRRNGREKHVQLTDKGLVLAKKLDKTLKYTGEIGE